MCAIAGLEALHCDGIAQRPVCPWATGLCKKQCVIEVDVNAETHSSEGFGHAGMWSCRL